jgi:hypothetical protein
MLKKILPPILLALTILLAACGPLTLPTMSPADAQGTAVSATLTSIAATQAAIPTNTPPPPTETASPTPTLEPSLPPPATTEAPNNCVKTLNMGEAGLLKNVRIENENKSTVNVSLNLYTPNSFGQCGALSYSLKGGAKMNIQIPTGSWSAYSWVLDPPSTGSVSFIIGTSKSKDLLRLVIKKDVIAWVGP